MYIGRIFSGIIIIIIALFLLDMAVGFLNPPVDDTETIVGEGNLSHQSTLMGEDVIEGEFTVQNGTINFLICDKENYNKYRKTNDYNDIEHYELLENVTKGSYEFETPESDTFFKTEKWYIIYDTTNSTADETIIESHIEYEPFRTLIYYVKIVFILIGCIQLLLGFRGKPKTDKE